MISDPNKFYNYQIPIPGFVTQGHVFILYDDPLEEDEEWDTVSSECDEEDHELCQHCACFCHWAADYGR